jgi:hemolysin III
MSFAIPDEYLVEHYPSLGERAADRWIHVVAIYAAVVATLVLIVIAIAGKRPGLAMALALYGAALTAMLGLSALYNLSRISPARPFLRRLDEAGIFLMIAGSYMPFTTQILKGGWSIGMTGLVWTMACLGIVGKLALPRLSERLWTGVYVAFGWTAVLAVQPLSQTLPVTAMALLVAGGLVYTGGCLIFLNQRLPFRRAVWHGFVCAGAALHFGAVIFGVVLAPVGV